MKKKTYMFLCVVLLALAGCGKPQKNENPQENGNPVSENISEETEHKDTQDAGQNEQQTGQAADNGAYPPCVMVDGILYKDTGYVASMPGCGTMDGEIVSAVAGTELPSENDQSNFGTGYPYQRSSEGHIIVVIDGERMIFRDMEKKIRQFQWRLSALMAR